jgi:4-amino-4-deoxy-L-arabinose transferase-like glycosyltransferase
MHQSVRLDPRAHGLRLDAVRPRPLPKRSPGSGRLNAFGLDTLSCAPLVVVALVIGLYNVHETGTLWPDGPRYSNAAAMIHDWFVSGAFLHPYEFAKQNYTQYPAFSVPYHPPLYPALLGLFFLITNVSYLSARIFIGLCLGGSACVFFAILRRMHLDRIGCLLCSLLLITTPDIAHWARDTMSEVPGLAFMLAGSYLFLRWLNTGNWRCCWAAFGLAEAAFLCRVTTAGLLPCWLLYGLLSKRYRQVFSWQVLLGCALYLALNVSYVRFAAQFGRFEVAADGRANVLSCENLRYFSECVPPLLLSGSAVAGLAGLIGALIVRRRQTVVLFWLCWLLSYTFFKAAMPTTLETRHYFGALPALAGLAGGLFTPAAAAWSGRKRAFALCALALAANAHGMGQIPRGIVGYEEVAQHLAVLEKPGNVLLACWEDQDLIFRYRAQQPGVRRLLLRGDRTLAVRGPCYANMQVRTVACSGDDVLELLQRGRVRYLVTCLADDPEQDIRYSEMILAHEAAWAHRESFALLGTYAWELDFPSWRRTGRVFLWEFLESYPEGPTDLPIVIPTADLELRP